LALKATGWNAAPLVLDVEVRLATLIEQVGHRLRVGQGEQRGDRRARARVGVGGERGERLQVEPVGRRDVALGQLRVGLGVQVLRLLKRINRRVTRRQ
jgi:hypothetical protein